MLKKHTTLKIVEIARLAGMQYHAAGKLIRTFEKEINDSENLRKIIRKTEDKIFNK